jgi:hypothetical protein
MAPRAEAREHAIRLRNPAIDARDRARAISLFNSPQ